MNFIRRPTLITEDGRWARNFEKINLWRSQREPATACASIWIIIKQKTSHQQQHKPPMRHRIDMLCTVAATTGFAISHYYSPSSVFTFLIRISHVLELIKFGFIGIIKYMTATAPYTYHLVSICGTVSGNIRLTTRHTSMKEYYSFPCVPLFIDIANH